MATATTEQLGPALAADLLGTDAGPKQALRGGMARQLENVALRKGGIAIELVAGIQLAAGCHAAISGAGGAPAVALDSASRLPLVELEVEEAQPALPH